MIKSRSCFMEDNIYTNIDHFSKEQNKESLKYSVLQ